MPPNAGARELNRRLKGVDLAVDSFGPLRLEPSLLLHSLRGLLLAEAVKCLFELFFEFAFPIGRHLLASSKSCERFPDLFRRIGRWAFLWGFHGRTGKRNVADRFVEEAP